MPFISIETLDESSDTRLTLWRMSENVSELLSLCISMGIETSDVSNRYKSESRLREVLSVRLLLHNIFGNGITISHNDEGRPYLSNHYNISISHTKDVAAVIVSRLHAVSIDIERIHPRILKVRDKIIRMDEKAEGIVQTLIHWCTKETLYKFFSSEHLALYDMRVNAICGDSASGTIHAENLRSSVNLIVHYRITDDFVLTFIH